MSSPKLPSPDARTRIAVFGSFYRGFYVLSEMLQGTLKDRVQVVGVASDDTTQKYVHPHVRVWQYPHATHEETMVPDLAKRHHLQAYCGSVQTEPFQTLFTQDWRPDLCIMATFGQRIPARIFKQPALGFFNLHPCTEGPWPSRYAGSNPFQNLIDEKRSHTAIAMHQIDEDFDAGKLIAYSEPIPIPPGTGVVDLHKITSFTAARLATTQIALILDRGRVG